MRQKGYSRDILKIRFIKPAKGSVLREQKKITRLEVLKIVKEEKPVFLKVGIVKTPNNKAKLTTKLAKKIFNAHWNMFKKLNIFQCAFSFSKNNFSKKPMRMVSTLIAFIFVLSFFATGADVLFSKPKINQAAVIKDIIVKQASPAVASQPTSYSLLLKRSAINHDKYLVKLPKGALNVTVKITSAQDAKQILSKNPSEITSSLTLEQKQQLAKAIPRFPKKENIFAMPNNLFSANITEAVWQFTKTLRQEITQKVKKKIFLVAQVSAEDIQEQSIVLESVTPKVIETPDASFVDVSSQADTSLIEVPADSTILSDSQQDSQESNFQTTEASDSQQTPVKTETSSGSSEENPSAQTEISEPKEASVKTETETETLSEGIQGSLNQDNDQFQEESNIGSSQTSLTPSLPEDFTKSVPQHPSFEESAQEVADRDQQSTSQDTEDSTSTPTPDETSENETIEESVSETASAKSSGEPKEEKVEGGIAEEKEFVQIDFEVPAPKITEQDTDQGKEVTIFAPDVISSGDQLQPTHLTNVLAFTTIPEIFKVGQEDKIQIKWKNENNQVMPFTAHDTDGNGKLDYLEWTVPHLSEQIFDIIFISKAFLLDKNKEIIEDIYDIVRTKDDIWQGVAEGQYIRATFERNLTNKNDITIYAKSGSGATIEVYPIYTDQDGNQTEGERIATFQTITQEAYYKVLLPELPADTNIFDLKITNNVEIDFIVDANRYWVGSAGGNTNDTANWASADPASCTGGGASVPGSSDIAIFDADCDNNATINANLDVIGVDIKLGYTGTITQNASITVTVGTSDWIQADGTFSGSAAAIDMNDAFTLSGGTFTSTSGTMTVAGSFTLSGAPTFTHNSGTVTFDGTGTVDTLNSQTFNNVTINSAGTVTLNNNLLIDNTLTLTAGTLDVSASNYEVTAKSWTDTGAGTFTEGTGTVTFSTAGGTINSNEAFNNVTINHGGTTTLGADLAVSNVLTITLGTLDASSRTITLSGTTGTPFSNSSTFTASTGTVTYTGNNAAGDTTIANVTYNNLTVNNSSETYVLSANLDVNDTVTITAGVLDVTASNFNITAKSWTDTGTGTFTEGTGTVTFDVAGGTINSNETFNNVTINHAGTTTLGAALDLAATLTITAGTLDISGSNYGITLKSWTDTGAGTFTEGTGTVTFDVAGGTVNSNETFNSVTINHAGTTTLGAALDLADTLTITAGTLDVSASNYGITAKSWTDTGTGTFTEGTGTVTFDVAGGTINANESFYNVTINHAGTTTLGAATTATNNLTITAGTLNVSASNYGITVGNNYSNSGTFTAQSGTVTFNATATGKTITAGGSSFYNLTFNGVGGGWTLQDAATVSNVLTITNGTLNGGSVTLTLSGTTGTPFSNSGTFTASTGTVTYTGNNAGGNTTITNVTYNNLTANNSSETYVLSAALDVNDTVTLTAGTIDVTGSNYGITAKSWTDTGAGTFTEGTGTVTFDVAGGTINSNETFENVTINHAGTTTLGAALDLDDTLTITGGALDVSASNYGITAKSWTDTGAGTFTEGTGTVTFDVAGGTINSNEAFNSITINHAGTSTLGANTSVGGVFTITSGTLNASSYTITLSGTGTIFSNSGTYTAGTSTISITNTSSTSKTFAGGGGTYNDINIASSGSGVVIISGSNTFDDFTINPPKTVTFTSSATQTIGGTFSCTGTAGNIITINSSSSGTAGTLSKASGTVSCDYLSLQDSAATGGATWNPGTNSTNVSGNSGWVFNTAPTISAGPSDNGSYLASPTKNGSNVSFTATATDSGSDNYYLAICKTNSITAVNSGAPTCGGGNWCISSSTASGSQASCTYTALATESRSNDWYAFVCDHNSSSFCSSSSQGSGNDGSPFNLLPDISGGGGGGGGGSGGGGGGTPADVFLGDFSLLINNGNAITDTRNVVLTINSNVNAQSMSISNSPDFTNAPQESYQSTKFWTLTGGQGNKTVYVKLFNKYGASSNVFSASIEYKIKSIIEEIKQIVPPVVEKIGQIVPPLVEEIKQIVPPIIDKIIEIVLPKPKPLEIPAIGDIVKKETPPALRGEWDFLFGKEVKLFVFAPLPKATQNLIAKLPELKKTFNETGITTFNSTVQKLQGVELTVPGLGKRTLVGQQLNAPKIPRGQFALPKSIPLVLLPSNIKNSLPSEVVFARTADELIDFNILISLNSKGALEQRIDTLSGKELKLAVKPDGPVNFVKGYLVLKSKASSHSAFSMALNYLKASLSFANPVLAASVAEPVKIETKLLLEEFDYKDEDIDGIYTATIFSPVPEGEYEVITAISYKDIKIGDKEIRLIIVVDPEGYVYSNVMGGQLRINGAIVSLYWLNPATKKYELWPAAQYQQENPQVTNETGKYSFLVPDNNYYLTVTAPKYAEFTSEVFTVKSGNGVHMNIELKSANPWLTYLDWKTVLLVLVFVLLAYIIVSGKLKTKP